MIAITTKTGRLGNRLTLFAHFIAFASEYKVNVVNPAFLDYANLFKGTCDSMFCIYPRRKSHLGHSLPVPYRIRACMYRLIDYCVKARENKDAKYVKVVSSCSRNNNVTLSSPEFLSYAKRKNLFCKGYYFSDHDSVLKHATLIRAFFEPIDRHMRKAEDTMQRVRIGCDLVVGVHIRQGDYRRHRDGQWFFETPFYAKVMHNLKSLLGKQRGIRFLICSDTPQSDVNFKGLNCFFSRGEAIEDLYLLSMCDYIVGPPSSFSRWASFYGDVPLGVLLSKDTQLVFDKFGIIDRL